MKDKAKALPLKNENLDFMGEPDKLKIVVLGVGGAGSNAVDNMIRSMDSRSEENGLLEQVSFWSANTDAQALNKSLAPNKLQLGLESTKGLGAGSNPERGKIAAEESIEQLRAILQNCHMLFITAGMGGGTGTGAAPVIARLAMDMGVLTVAVVTKPFHFEGHRRMRAAQQGLDLLSQSVDALIIIPNQNLFLVANEKTTFAEAFKMADSVLEAGVLGIADLVIVPGVINLDFADIRAVMKGMGNAMLGIGISSISPSDGLERAIDAAERAITNPLLDKSSTKGAKALLINVSGGDDMTLFEVDAAITIIKKEVDPNANLIFGSSYDHTLQGRIKVVVVATGISSGKEEANSTSYNEQVADVSVSQPQSASVPEVTHGSSFHTVNTDSQYNEEDEEEEQSIRDSFISHIRDANQRSNFTRISPSLTSAADLHNEYKSSTGDNESDDAWQNKPESTDEDEYPSQLLSNMKKSSYFMPPEPIDPETYRQFPHPHRGDNRPVSPHSIPINPAGSASQDNQSRSNDGGNNNRSLLSRVTRMIRNESGNKANDAGIFDGNVFDVPSFFRRKNDPKE